MAASRHKASESDNDPPGLHELERWNTVYARGLDDDVWPTTPAKGPSDLAAHTRRIAALRDRIRGHLGASSAADTVFDTLPPATFICDGDGRILHRNAAARALTGASARTISQALGAGARSTGPTLSNLVLEAADGALGGIMRTTVGGHRYTVVVRALGPDKQSRACLVAAFDDATGLGPAAEVLKRSFLLTPAELRLAEELLIGGTLPEIAARLRIAHETVRSQLRSLFHKTGTDRQIKLLRLLLQVQLASRPADIA